MSEDHRLALLGLITSQNQVKILPRTNKSDLNTEVVSPWTEVKNTNKKHSAKPEIEKSEMEIESKKYTVEAKLVQAKKSGFRRTNPSSPSLHQSSFRKITRFFNVSLAKSM